MSAMYRAAVIGHTGRGDYGHGLDRVWSGLANVELVALADADEAGRAAAAQRLKVERTFADYRQMLDETRPDFVSIGPRHVDQHHAMLRAAIERGIHVYCEKPVARTLAEIDELIDLADRTHAAVALAHQTRYSPRLPVVERLLREGAIGRLREIRARGKDDHRGGGEDLWVLGTHTLDLTRVFGGQPTRCEARVLVAGQAAVPADDVEGNEGLGPLTGDEVHAVYTLPNEVTGRFDSARNAATKPSRFGVELIGEQGVLTLGMGYLPAARWREGAADDAPWRELSSEGVGVPEPLTDGGADAGNLLAVRDLIAAVEEHRPPRCNLREARSVVEMISAVFASHVAGGPVTLPLVERDNPLRAWRGNSS